MSSEAVKDVTETSCVVVGGGPAGCMLALLLARQGVAVTLLEAHNDFDREFRGDTLHPSILEIMDHLGLSEKLHAQKHTKIHTGTIMTADGPVSVVDFRRIKTRFPYIMLIPQPRFLTLVTEEAKKYPNFRLVMGANVQRLVEEDGAVRGVEYRTNDGAWHRVRAQLTVGADGRFSRLRHLLGLKPISTSPPMDILWFTLPHLPDDPIDTGVIGRPGYGRMLVIFDREDHWQVGYVFPKGGFAKLREQGLEAFRESVAQLEPTFRRHMEHITDWHQMSLLSVESSYLRRWHVPGLLLIGDAAHVMSPVGGVGINYAVQDAVVASNVLGPRLLAGDVRRRDLIEVQRRRAWPTRVIQTFQAFVQRRIIAGVLGSRGQVRVPWFVRLLLRIPIIRDIPARFIGWGVVRVRVKT